MILVDLQNILDGPFVSVHLSDCLFLHIDQPDLAIGLPVDEYLGVVFSLLSEGGEPVGGIVKGI